MYVQDGAENEKTKLEKSRQVNDELQELVLSIGVPPNLYGYDYIIYAMELIILNPDYIHAITKGVYIDVAKKFDTTPSKVERAIRHSINVAWLHGNIKFINKIFVNCVRPDKGVPTNSVFLARLYYYIKSMWQYESLL